MDEQERGAISVDPSTSTSNAIQPWKANIPFSNIDLVDDFCECLCVDDDAAIAERKQSRATLRALALTCKSLLEPALDRLWRSLDYLYPLLKILPAFVQSEETYVIRGPITQEDWARFDWYGRRVRKFQYRRDPDELDIAMHVYFRIAQLRNTPLLPNLRHLWCPRTSQADFLVSGICLFLSPSLTSVTLEAMSGVEDKLCGTFLHTLHSDGAVLESVILKGRGLSSDTLTIAVQFQQLRKLEITGMGPNLNLHILSLIGALPRLSDLTLDLENTPIAISTDIGLRDLKCLKITAPIPFVHEFLARTFTPHLESLAVVCLPGSSTMDKKTFLEGVVDRWKNSLRHVSFAHSNRNHEDEVDSLSISSLSPLLRIPGFMTLCIDGYSMEINDEDIGQFARAWPQLRQLMLPSSTPDLASPTITSLQMLARSCPHLQQLRIPLDLDNLPEFTPSTPHPSALSSTSSSRAFQPELEKLLIASPEDEYEWRDYLRLSRYIDHLFPRVKVIAGDAPNDPERWVQVGEMVKMFQNVRSEVVLSAMG